MGETAAYAGNALKREIGALPGAPIFTDQDVYGMVAACGGSIDRA